MSDERDTGLPSWTMSALAQDPSQPGSFPPVTSVPQLDPGNVQSLPNMYGGGDPMLSNAIGGILKSYIPSLPDIKQTSDPLDPRNPATASPYSTFDPLLSPAGMAGVNTLPVDSPVGAAMTAALGAGKKFLSPAVRAGTLAMGALLGGSDPAEAKSAKFPLTGLAIKDTLENLASRNRLVPTKDILEKTLNPHDIPVGSWMTPLVGDRSASGQLLTHIGDKELDKPVWMQGGWQFMPEWAKQGIVWASDQSPTSAIGNRVQRFLNKDPPAVYGAYTAMSPTAVDASHHMSDALSQMMQLQKKRIGKTAAEQFDDTIREAYPDFPGVKSDKLQDYLRQNTMAMRNTFASTMNTRDALDAGFPDVGQARIAVTHPMLREAPSYSGGLSIGTMTGERTHGSRGFGPAAHYTYPSKLLGEYKGGFGQPVPQELMWPDFSAKLARRDPSAAGKIWMTGLKARPNSPATIGQLVTPQWQDNIAEYLRSSRMGDLAEQ